MSDIPFTEWLCTQCDDTECRFSVNANLRLIRPIRCPLDTWAVNPQSIFERVNYIDQQIQKEQWCGDCGFKGSDTCNDGTTWKRCRLMSSEPEGKNVEDRLELARNSAIEKVLGEVERKLNDSIEHDCKIPLIWVSDVERIFKEFRQASES